MRFSSKQLITAIDVGNATVRAASVSIVNGEMVLKGVAEKCSYGVKKSGIVISAELRPELCRYL